MRFNFRKIASVLASATMISSTVALAAAANYPAPFVSGGQANVAVVYGSNAALTDVVAASNIQTDLQAKLAAQTASTGGTVGGTVTGESAPLFTGSAKMYINDTMDIVRTILTDTELPVLLKDGSFSGNVDATYVQTIEVGHNPQLTFAKQPTSTEDPAFGYATSTTSGNNIYNATISFNKAVNFTHGDSEGESIDLFGTSFTIAAATDMTNLVLLKSAEKVSLSNTAPTADVVIAGKTYTLELVSASDTSATIKVTDETGASDSKEINEAASKKVNGITIAVQTSDETNLKLSATLVAGAEKITLTEGTTVAVGEDDDSVDGTRATFYGQTPNNLTKLSVSIRAPNSDEDAILPGTSFTDPVFGTFKVDFAGLNIADAAEAVARESIIVRPNGDNKMELSMTDRRGNTKAFQFAMNDSTTGISSLTHDSDGRNITVQERGKTYKGAYIVVGNEEDGYLLEVDTISNASSGYSSDKLKLKDVFDSTNTFEATATSEGRGTISIGGKVYSYSYGGAATDSDETRWVRLNYPDSTGTGDAVVFPTFQTSKGALIMLYKPINLTMNSWDNDGAMDLETNYTLSSLKVPNGDGYTTVYVTINGTANTDDIWYFNTSATTSALNTTAGTGAQAPDAQSTTFTAGIFTWNVSVAGDDNKTTLRLVNPDDSVSLKEPAVVIIEEKDDNSQYHAIIVTLEQGNTGTDGMGVEDVVRSWQSDDTWDAISLASDSKKSKEADLWGTIALLDSSDSDQKSVTISYPDEQVYAQIYFGGIASSVTAGTATGGSVKELGSVAIADTEAASASTKNLVVVGGSCVNSVAAGLVGGAKCGADWQTATSVGAGSYLIQTFDRGNGKIATLVAGYNALDTTNAAKAFTTQTIDTTAGKKYTGTTATAVTAVTTATTA